MVKVCLMNLEKESNKFRFLKEMELPRVPVAGDKILIVENENSDEMLNTLVYDVVSVHFDKYGKTDVLVVNIGKHEDYLRLLASERGILASMQCSK